MTLAWGIAATGRMARTVGSLIAAHPDMRVAAVGSRDPGRGAALAAELGAARSHPSYDELVADPDVEAVYVATPHAMHAEVVELALAAGLPVLCEKPLTHSLAETERLLDLAIGARVFLMEAVWTRFNPLVQQLADLVHRGELGEVRSVHAAFGLVAPDDPAHRLWDPALGGGALLDLGIYPVDFARLLLGNPDRVQATGRIASTGVDADAGLLLSFLGGARALLDTSLTAVLPSMATVSGTLAYAELGPAFHAPTWLRLTGPDGTAREVGVADRSAGYVGELDEVARCLAAGRTESAVLPLSETLATMTVLDQARQLLS